MARHNEIGKLGEDIACDFLIGKGLVIVERNYRKPYGEIDIVARETSPWWVRAGGKCHFVEVKSVSHETGMEEGNEYRPEKKSIRQKSNAL